MPVLVCTHDAHFFKVGKKITLLYSFVSKTIAVDNEIRYYGKILDTSQNKMIPNIVNEIYAET